MSPTHDENDRRQALDALQRRHLEARARTRELAESLAQLQQERAPNEGFFERIPIAYCKLDGSGHIRYINAFGRRLLGFNRSSPTRLDFGTLLSKRQRGSFYMQLAACFDRAEVMDLELTLHRDVLPSAFVHFRGVPSLADDGQVVGCSAAIVDVTLGKRTEADLRLLARAAKHLASSLDRRRIAGIATRMAIPRLGDGAILCLSGTDPAESLPTLAHVDRKVEDRALDSGRLTLHSGDRTRLMHLEPKCVSGSSGMESDPTLPSNFPGLFHEMGCGTYLAVPLARGDDVLGALYLLSCSSKRVFTPQDHELAESYGERVAAALENARLYQGAQEAIRLREDVLAIVSHDLRTPLHTMLLNVEMLQASAPSEERRAVGRRQVEVIRRAVLSMDRMIADLLDLSSIEAGHLSVRRGMHGLRSMMSDALEPYSSRVTAKQLHVALELPPDELQIPCDRERVIQVLTNLIGNAVKFTPADGRIRLWCVAGLDVMKISIFNSGPGIASSRLPRVFDRYWQASETAQGGRGLGLFIAKGIVEAHGGRIRVQSDVEHGTTFTITFPLEAGSALPAASPIEPLRISDSKTSSVLIVEDEPEQREAMAAVLAGAGHQVNVAPDGKAALEHVETQDPASVVLLDLNMPGIPGETVLRELHRNRRWSDVPVVLVSSEPDVAKTSSSLGAAAYLRKPVPTEALVMMVQRFAGISRG